MPVRSVVCAFLVPLTSAFSLAAAPTYPLTARIDIPAQTRELCYEDKEYPGCASHVGLEVEHAFQTMAFRLFDRPAEGAAPDLTLEVSIRDVGFESAMFGRRATIAGAVQIRSATSGDVDRLTVRGDAELFTSGPEGITDAFARAARDMAAHFERLFPNSEPMVRWLLARRITPAGSSILGSARADLAVFGDASGELLEGPEGFGPGFRAKIGFEAPWLVLQGSFVTWSAPYGPGGGLTASAWTVEVGPAWRFTRNFEVRGGVGLEFMSGTVDAGTSQTSHNLDFSRTMPTAFAAVQWAWAKKGSTSQNRVRVGAELRYAFDHDVAFSEVQKVIQVAGFSAGVFVGVEFPLIPSRAPPLSL